MTVQPHHLARREIASAIDSVSGDPTILALRRGLEREAAALKAGEHLADTLVRVVQASLPKDIFQPVFLPANGTGRPRLAIAVSDRFDRYVAFATEYFLFLIGHGAEAIAD